MTTAAEVKEAWTMEMVLDLVEIEYTPGPAAGFKIHSIFNEEKTPSMHIYEDHWYDYSSGKGGDVISFVQEYMGCSFGAAMRYLERGVGDPMEWQRPAVVAKEITRVNLYDRLLAESKPLIEEASEWLCDRIRGKWGVDMLDLNNWGVRVGPGESLWIPHYHGPEEVWGIHVRDLRADKKFSVKGSWFTCGPYKQIRPYRNLGEAWIIVEGEPDAWAVKRCLGNVTDPDVLALPTGAGTIREEWFGGTLAGQPAYVCFDRDSAGRKATKVIKRMVPGIVEIPLPEDVGDCADAYREGWRLRGDGRQFAWSK